MVRICIADDFPVVRKGIKDYLEENPEFRVEAEAQNGEELIALLQKKDFDVILLDMAMPGGGGFATLGEVKRLRPDVPVLIFSMYPEEHYAVRAIRAGASGYLNKTSDPAHLATAIRKVVAGKKYISTDLAERLATGLSHELEAPPHERLAPRERQVMLCLAQGLSVSQTACRLRLGIKTVGTYRFRILRKMSLRHNAELIRYAAENGLMDG